MRWNPSALRPLHSRTQGTGRTGTGACRMTPRRRTRTSRQLARHRIAIEAVTPEIDAGRFAAKGVEGRPVEDHGRRLRRRPRGHRRRRAAPERRQPGRHGGADDACGQRPLARRRGAGRHRYAPLHHRRLARPLRDVAPRHREEGRGRAGRVGRDRGGAAPSGGYQGEGRGRRGAEGAPGGGRGRRRARRADGPRHARAHARIGPQANRTLYPRELPLWIDRERAVFGAWYELFPRSLGEGRTTAPSTT
jgi:starch synthase (maltosyl-transferring)